MDKMFSMRQLQAVQPAAGMHDESATGTPVQWQRPQLQLCELLVPENHTARQRLGAARHLLDCRNAAHLQLHSMPADVW